MTKQIHIESTLAKIANAVFESKNFTTAQQVALEYLQECKIKESDKNKMIDEITKKKNLIGLQSYIANALLRYEGLSVNKRTQEKTEPNESFEI